MFDDVHVNVKCPVPKCKNTAEYFQTKDTHCLMSSISPGDDMRQFGWMDDTPFEIHAGYCSDGKSAHSIDGLGIVYNHIFITAIATNVQSVGDFSKEIWAIRDGYHPRR